MPMVAFTSINMPATVIGERIGRSLLGRWRQQKALFCATFVIMLHKSQLVPNGGPRSWVMATVAALPAMNTATM
jgi:hypothetical protein